MGKLTGRERLDGAGKGSWALRGACKSRLSAFGRPLGAGLTHDWSVFFDAWAEVYDVVIVERAREGVEPVSRGHAASGGARLRASESAVRTTAG